MTTKNDSPTDKKLASIRKILWLSFAGFSIPAILCTSIPLLIFPVSNMGSIGITELIILAAGPFMLVGVIGIVCLVIYNIIKVRLERNDDLFL
jgi:hypothetical protein